MILPYFVKLFCLCLASFFLLHAALGLAVWLVAPVAIRLVEKMQARMAARFLLFLRLLPILAAGVVVLGVGVPSYMWLEPRTTGESVGLACFAAALLGLASWCVSIARALRLALRSSHYMRRCERIGREISVGGASIRTSLLDLDAPVIALAGVFRPKVWVSRSVIDALSAEQLEAALRHENAHRVSRDNLKRLLFRLAPDIFPLTLRLGTLERAWARFSEWAADDETTCGDARLSLVLAAALVRVARLGAAPPQAVSWTPLIAGDLSTRVDRLLGKKVGTSTPAWRGGALLGMPTILTVFAATVMHWAVILRAAHEILERLVS
ncbi:MAG: hypothetical protein WCA91_04455 [Candidatus Acidiferrales bacterium]